MYLKKIMAATFAATALAGQAQEKTFSIIPEPVEITVTGQGEYLIQRNTVIRMSEPTLAPSATYLADYMERYLGIPLQVELPKSGKFCFILHFQYVNILFSAIYILYDFNRGTN